MKFGFVVYKTIAINLWIDVPSTVDDSVKDLETSKKRVTFIATSIPHFLGVFQTFGWGGFYIGYDIVVKILTNLINK